MDKEKKDMFVKNLMAVGKWLILLSSPVIDCPWDILTKQRVHSMKSVSPTTHTQEQVLRYGITLCVTIWASYPKEDMKKQDQAVFQSIVQKKAKW